MTYMAESGKASAATDSSEQPSHCDFKLKPNQNKGELLKKCQAQIIEDGKDIKGIITKYNKKVGYLKKFHARSDAQTRIEQLLLENPIDLKQCCNNRRASQDERKKGYDRASDKTSDTSESPEKSTNKLPLLPLTTKRSIVTKRGRSCSRAIEEKFQTIFQEPETYLPNLSNCNGSCTGKNNNLNQTTPIIFSDEGEAATELKTILYF